MAERGEHVFAVGGGRHLLEDVLVLGDPPVREVPRCRSRGGCRDGRPRRRARLRGGRGGGSRPRRPRGTQAQYIEHPLPDATAAGTATARQRYSPGVRTT